MNSEEELREWVWDIQKRIKAQLPNVINEIEVYEKKLEGGTLTQHP